MPKKNKKDAVARMIQRTLWLQEQIESVKPYYHELDDLMDGLLQAEFQPSKYGVELVDLIAEQVNAKKHSLNTVWKSVSYKRFELRRRG